MNGIIDLISTVVDETSDAEPAVVDVDSVTPGFYICDEPKRTSKSAIRVLVETVFLIAAQAGYITAQVETALVATWSDTHLAVPIHCA